MPRAPKIQFRVAGELADHIESRTREGWSANETAKADLERYYAAVAVTLRGLDLTQAESSLIVDALNGVFADVRTPDEARGHILLAVSDAMRLEGASKKWAVDSDKMLSIIHNMSEWEALAVLDAASRFWVADSTRPTSDVLREVGLLQHLEHNPPDEETT